MNQTALHRREYDKLLIEHHKRVGKFNMSSNHYHYAYEIYYLVSGKRYYFIKDRTYPVEKGDIVVINTYDLHKTTDADSRSHERILLNFKDEFLSDISRGIEDMDIFSVFHKNINVIRLDERGQNYIERMLFKIIQESKNEAAGYEMLIKTTLIDLLIFLNRYEEQVDTKRFEHVNPSYEKVSQIVKFINENYMQAITLKLLSEFFFISPCYLSRTFKRTTGFSFVEYLNSIRIREAQKLLRESGLNITQIAQRVGYESCTHFGRVFKSITGFSPLRYRKLNRVCS